jgi:hypothetical protein
MTYPIVKLLQRLFPDNLIIIVNPVLHKRKKVAFTFDSLLPTLAKARLFFTVVTKCIGLFPFS